jgi:malate dehydrogenase
VIYRIASGELLGKDQPVNIHLHDLEMFEKKMQGVEMEIYDCAFPLVNSVKVCTDYAKAFEGVK